MTAVEYGKLIDLCADSALKERDAAYAPRHFIAALSGALSGQGEQAKAVADKLSAILERS